MSATVVRWGCAGESSGAECCGWFHATDYAPADAVLLFDGVFLMRPELIDRWDLRIFVSAAFEKTLARARTRDQTSSRSATEVERRYRSRYMPSQQFYFDTVRPTDHADIIVHNDDPQHPAWEARQKATNSQDESP